jgi:peptidyl-prolyl cis-trans isomerase SurA
MTSFRPTFISLIRCLAILLLLGPSPRIGAQETQRVAAVVNEEIVSLLDLDQRTRLALLSSNLPDTAETRARLLPAVLRRLIDEHLETQEAARLKIVIPANEIAAGIASIERQNNMPSGTLESLLKERGIDPDTVRQQIRAELAWRDAIRHELVPNLHIGENEIDARLATLKANQGKPEYLAAEIFLAVDSSSRDEEVRTLAERLIDQMRQGAPFSAVARQFSQTGAAGGDLGWVSEGMLDDELMAALAKLDKGQASPPIRTVDGYHILLLRDKRIAGEETAPSTTVELLTIVLSSVPSATAAEREDQLKRLRDALAAGKTCDDYERLAPRIPSASAFRSGRMALNDVPLDIAPMIKDLQPGAISEPLSGPNNRRLFAVCSRTETKGGLPSREDVRRRLEDEHLETMATGYLRNMRRAAFVEIRM